jgi:hypothetical protein
VFECTIALNNKLKIMFTLRVNVSISYQKYKILIVILRIWIIANLTITNSPNIVLLDSSGFVWLF